MKRERIVPLPERDDPFPIERHGPAGETFPLRQILPVPLACGRPGTVFIPNPVGGCRFGAASLFFEIKFPFRRDRSPEIG
jgi:hypothetical protein